MENARQEERKEPAKRENPGIDEGGEEEDKNRNKQLFPQVHLDPEAAVQPLIIVMPPCPAHLSTASRRRPTAHGQV